MKKTVISLTLFTALLGMVSCGSKEDEKAVSNEKPVAVHVSEITAQTNGSFLVASGKIEAEKSANLSTRMMGYVTVVKVKVGDRVSQGQLLVAINSTDLQAKKAQAEAGVLQAQAAYNNAQKDYERFKTLYTQNSASQKELDDMTSRYEMAKAGLEGAKQMKNEVMAQFSYTNITAPFSGIITNKFVKEGDMANPGMPLVSVEAPGALQVTAMIPETEIDAVKADMEVTVEVKSIGKSLKGKVTEVSLSSKNTGGQFLVKINLTETDDSMLPGMYANIQFPVAKTNNENAVVYVPEEAIIYKGQLTGIYTVSESKTAILRWLRLGKTFGDSVEVLSGLSADEQYILKADSKLYNGAKLTIE